VSATTPFSRDDLPELRDRVPQVVRRLYPEYETEYRRRGWTMMSGIDRVYVNERARRELGWQPVHDFQYVLTRLRADENIHSDLSHAVGSKGYHPTTFAEGPYPVE
jgi:nucleoside-diphosphate-sugar epimerase